MRTRLHTIAVAALFAAMLALPQATAASSSKPDLELSLYHGNAGQFGISWTDVGSAPITGTTTIIVNLPEGMTTELAQFADTCSPYSQCKSVSETVSANHRTLTFEYTGGMEVGQTLPLKLLYTPAVEASKLPPGTITATVSNSVDPNAANQASYQVGVETQAEKEAEAKEKEREAKAKEKAKEKESSTKEREAREREAREAEAREREKEGAGRGRHGRG